uniref:Uncharacterized protein n=1 Tax=viral metagenome TaxID=1070528 RepID=A0A6M3KML1_9ZZZZ
MSECLNGRKWEELRAMSFQELCTLPCVEILDENGESRNRFGMFLMVPTTQYIQAQCDFKGGLSNTAWQLPELEPELEPKPEPAPLYVSDHPSKPKTKRRQRVKV